MSSTSYPLLLEFKMQLSDPSLNSVQVQLAFDDPASIILSKNQTIEILPYYAYEQVTPPLTELAIASNQLTINFTDCQKSQPVIQVALTISTDANVITGHFSNNPAVAFMASYQVQVFGNTLYGSIQSTQNPFSIPLTQ